MSPERLSVARRLVGCKRWSPLPGMKWRWWDGSAIAGANGIPVSGPGPAIPDLDDDLTRLGVLAVVRRAWASPTGCLTFIYRHPIESTWEYRGRWICHGPTEEAALLAALEAAP